MRQPKVSANSFGAFNMRVFVTGATGFVGSATVADLIAAGHQVLGLARSDTGAAALTAAGAEVQRGSLEDLDSLRAGAAAVDGVIHTAFNHDFSRFAQNCEEDRAAIEAMGEVLAGSERPLLATSGVALLAPGRVAVEADALAISEAWPRASETAARAMAAKGVHASVVRLAPSVHDVGDHGFVPMLISIARQTGVAAYIGDGQNRWPGVHRLDAARLYRLALEHAAIGARYHGVSEEGVTMQAIAEVIGRRLGLPVVSKSPEEAAGHFGWFAMFAGMNAPTSSAVTQAQLGWAPTHPGLLADLDQPGYFET